MLGHEDLLARRHHSYDHSDAGTDDGRELGTKVCAQEIIRDHKAAGCKQAEGDHFNDTLHSSAGGIKHDQRHDQKDRNDETCKSQVKNRLMCNFRGKLVQRDSELIRDRAGEVGHIGQGRSTYCRERNRRAVGDQCHRASRNGRESKSYKQGRRERRRCAVSRSAFDESAEHISDDDRLNTRIRRDLSEALIDDLHDAGLLKSIQKKDRSADDQQKIQRFERAVDKVCKHCVKVHFPHGQNKQNRDAKGDDQRFAR